jgi:hypothetical protein
LNVVRSECLVDASGLGDRLQHIDRIEQIQTTRKDLSENVTGSK